MGFLPMEAPGVKSQHNLSAGCSWPLAAVLLPADSVSVAMDQGNSLSSLARWFLSFCLYEAFFPQKEKYQIPYLKDNCTYNGEIYTHLHTINSVMLLSEF